MMSKFARRVDEVRASDIREILKLTQQSEVISFAGGLPAAELFPSREVARVADRLLAEQGPRVLQYSTTEGHPPLREIIARRSNERWSTRLSADDILVTAGSQQALDLVGKLFLDEGDEVVVESPTYVGAITAWKVLRPRWVEVATDEEGMVPEALEAALESCTRPKFIYVVPNFQNPTGRTWSIARRRALLEAAARHQIPVVEDNPYGEVRFEGSHLPALHALGAEGQVLSLGTFSKVFCPGLRVGWVAAPHPAYEKLVILKQGADLHTSTLSQALTAAYIEEHGLDGQLARITRTYRLRRDAMVAALEEEMPEGVTFTRPEGGLFLWITLPGGVSARELLALCLERQVAFVPGGGFYPNGGHENTLRLNFSCMGEERIREGIRRMAAALGELLEAAQRPRLPREGALVG